MKDISVKMSKQEWLEILGAMLVLAAATLLPPAIAQIATALFFVLFAFFKPFQSLVILVPYVIFRTLLVELNPGLKLVGDLITVVVLFRLFLMNVKRFKTWFHFKPFEYFYFAFLIFGAAIGYKNGVSLGAIVFQLRTFGVMYLLYYIISRSELPKNFLVKLSWVTVFSGVLIFVQGIIERLSLRQLLMPELWTQKVLSSTNFVRIYGMLNNPNSLALVMFFAICAVFFLRWVYKDNQYKWLLRITQVAFFGMLLLTLSRGTWIAAFVFVLFFMLLARNWKLLLKIGVTFVVSIVLVYLPTNYGVQLIQNLGVENTIAPDDISGGIRTDSMKQCQKIRSH